ncbi:MAG: undecaprenyldiphospho-muramoylpentapeptide beta-N-acetylglucosaminyltransferase [bacterium]
MKVLLAGGGTGGHILPTLAVAAALQNKQPGIELLYVGSRRPQDRELVEAAGIPFQAISAGKLRRYFALENIADPFKFMRGVWEAGVILKRFRPQVVFAKGGYVSLPIVVAAGHLNIPVIVHESDSRLGRANRWALRSATKLALAFPIEECIKNSLIPESYRAKLVYTGLPIGRDLWEGSREPLFHNGKPIVMISGGSQGASAINDLVWGVLPQLANRYDLIHQVGEAHLSAATEQQQGLPADLQNSYLPFGFDRQLHRRGLRLADLIVGRAGSSIFEFAVLGKPTILIPLPVKIGDDQIRNSRFIEQLGAAVVLDQNGLTSEKLLAAIDELMTDTDKCKMIASQLAELGAKSREAAEAVAQLILSTVS